MNPKYQEWIEDQHYDLLYVAHTMCVEATRDMVLDFPELRIARGIVRYESSGYPKGKAVMHCWCVTADGEVVDPTVAQYKLVRLLGYQEVPEEELASLRRCINCGDLHTFPRVFCEDNCEQQYMQAN